MSTLVAILLLSWAGAARAQDPPAAAPQPFDAWLAELRAEALTRGIRPEVLDAAFAEMQPVEQILERDRTQAEFALNLTAYLKRRLTRRAVQTAQQMHTRASRPAPRGRQEVRRPAANHHRRLGARVELRPLRRRAADDPGARHARLRSAPRDALPQGALQRARDRESRRHRARAAEGIVGRRARPAAVHALDLSRVRAGLRRRRPARHLDVAGRRVRVGRPLPEGARLVGQRDVGPRGEGAEGRESQASMPLPRRTEGCRAERALTAPRPLKEWTKLGVRTTAGSRAAGRRHRRLDGRPTARATSSSTATTRRCSPTTAPRATPSASGCCRTG